MYHFQVISLLVLVLLTQCVKTQSNLGDRCNARYAIYGGTCKYFEDCPEANDLYGNVLVECISGERPIICCPRSPLPNSISNTRSTFDTDMIPKPTKSIHERKCEEYHKEHNKIVSPLPLDSNSINTVPNCRNNGPNLIRGGQIAKLGEFPHMAVIGYFESFTKTWIWGCGGTLISEEFVLTASHCSHYTDEPALKVRLGEHNVWSVNDGAQPIEISIKKFTRHKDYNGPKVYNDIALIQLEKRVSFTNKIRPACLWPIFNIDVEIAIATGYGTNTTISSSAFTGLLQKININVINDSDCREMYPHNTHLPQGIETDKMFCAKDISDNVETRKDTCEGDSGGPLQIYDVNNRCITYVIGITSYGEACGSGAIYTRVSNYVKWIEEHVWP